MKCPHCGNDINIGSLMGSATSKAKARAARRNAKLGGWPKGKKRGKRKQPDANKAAFGASPTPCKRECDGAQSGKRNSDKHCCDNPENKQGSFCAPVHNSISPSGGFAKPAIAFRLRRALKRSKRFVLKLDSVCFCKVNGNALVILARELAAMGFRQQMSFKCFHLLAFRFGDNLFAGVKILKRDLGFGIAKLFRDTFKFAEQLWRNFHQTRIGYGFGDVPNARLHDNRNALAVFATSRIQVGSPIAVLLCAENVPANSGCVYSPRSRCMTDFCIHNHIIPNYWVL